MSEANKIPRAVLYIRSSKDRSDVSMDAQRRELTALAATRGFLIAAEYSDEVISANDDRPGFQSLLAALNRPGRDWDAILVLDTSRLARSVYFAQVFNRECEKHGVRVIYAKLPELDPMMKIVLIPVLQAQDELHSYMSREKGLAGMRENVLQGFRAGGRAPWGYRLKKNPTGAVRDGAPVTKSTLELDAAQAPIVKAYLEARASGISRARAARDAGIQGFAPASLVGTDWQALTYAGHTVWNMHNPIAHRGRGARKRKPRSEWTIQRDTHEALITDDQAEAILQRLETSNMAEAVRSAKGQVSRYMLTGILRTPDGENWRGCQERDSTTGAPVGYYRTGNRRIQAGPLESTIVTRILADLKSQQFVDALVASARKQSAPAAEDPAKPLRLEQLRLAREIDATLEMAAQLTNRAPALRRVDALESQRNALTGRIADLDRQRTERSALALVTAESVRAMLGEISAHAERLTGLELKPLVEALIERIELEPEGSSARICYAVGAEATGGSVAFPRGFEPLLHP